MGAIHDAHRRQVKRNTDGIDHGACGVTQTRWPIGPLWISVLSVVALFARNFGESPWRCWDNGVTVLVLGD